MHCDTSYFRSVDRVLAIAVWLIFFLSAGHADADDRYKGNLRNVLGDVKQGQIQNKLDTKKKIDNVLDGFEKLGCNGVRITLFPRGTNPNPEMFDYLYQEAKKRGFKIFANPAQHAGGQRVASRSMKTEPVKNDLKVTNILIQDVKAFSKRYRCDWINPLNEDGIDVGAFTGPQIQYIYQKLHRRVGGADLIGPCTWGIPSAIAVLKKTTIEDYISVATTHNLGHNHGSWKEFVNLAKRRRLPVWDSEVNLHKKYPDRSHRFDAALEAGVDGLVLYDAWRSFVKPHNGDLTKTGINVRQRILKNPNQPQPKPNKYEPKEGDLLFQYTAGNRFLSALADASEQQFSHCGILVKKEGQWFVLEAAGSVKETPIKVWRGRNRDNLMHVYRLKDPMQKHIPKMLESGRKFLGRPDDFRCQMTDTKIYGPELVFKSFKRASGKELSQPVLIKQLRWKQAEAAILEAESSVPLQRKIITAEILSKSEFLQRVYSTKKEN